MRGLNRPLFATIAPPPSSALFLSHRTPRLRLMRSPTRQLSLRNSECILRFDPRLVSFTGVYQIWVEFGMNCGNTDAPSALRMELVP